MDEFVRSQNIERYRRLLERVTEEIRPTSDNQSACRRAAEAKGRWRSSLVTLSEYEGLHH